LIAFSFDFFFSRSRTFELALTSLPLSIPSPRLLTLQAMLRCVLSIAIGAILENSLCRFKRSKLECFHNS